MNKTLILYSTGCPKCAILKKKLDAAHITYTENNSVDEMQALGMTEAPSLFVDGELLGFRQAVDWVGEYVSERTQAD